MNTTPLKIAAAALAPLGLFVVYEVGKVIIPPYFSPLRRLPGPPNPSLMFGHLKHVFVDAEDTGIPFEEWIKTYGNTFVFKDAMNQSRLFTTDLKAIQHWMTHSYLYQKSEDSHYILGQILGEGLLVAEMDQHRRQRRIMNPAFGPLQLRNLSGIFSIKSQELRDVILARLSSSSDASIVVDVMDMLSKATLDMIGLAGFNYRFEALSTQGDSPNELNAAIHDIFSEGGGSISAMDVLAGWFPFLRIIPTRRKRIIQRGRAVMERMGRQMIAEKKAAVLASGSDVEKASVKDRDLLSLLVRANLAADLPESQRLSDDEILWQIPTFLAAGHETTSTATTWALHALSLDQGIQTRLREELRTLSLPQSFDEEPLDEESLNALSTLPFLDAVVRETLRYWAPVSFLGRIATQDDVVPLSTPVTDRYGVVHNSLRIAKGDGIWTPVLPLHRLKEIWGEDADKFNPDRWLRGNLRSTAGDMPGVWSYLLSFSGGPHACIGYRFAILEIKFLLHALVSTFVFRPAVENDVVRKSFIVDRPFLKSQPEKGSQLPLIVERA